MRSSRLVAAVTALGLVLAGADARANGRFPESNAIFFAPNDPGVVLLRTTFGLITSRDRGATWDWICERSIGLAGVEDPMYSVMPDGTFIASTFQGLAMSRDQMCNWSFAGGDLKDLVFIDLASVPATPSTVVAFASSYAGQDDEAGTVFFKSTLFETQDQGKTFTALGPPLDRSILGDTVDLAASDAQRVYLSAVRNPGSGPTAYLLTSHDRGKTFVEHSIALVSSERGAYIAGVDPNDADRVYVRTSNDVSLSSRLLVSDDAGQTFRTVYTGAGPLPGFALSTDGSKVWVGGPRDGLRVASTTDFAFQQRSTVEIGCLKLANDGLWACSSEKSGFVVGLSADEGATFQPKLHFCDVRGPLACATGSTQHTECVLGGTAANHTSPWPAQRAILGCSDGLDAGRDAANAGPDPMDGGGGCAMRTPTPTPIAAFFAGGAALVALVRRRSRSRTRR